MLKIYDEYNLAAYSNKQLFLILDGVERAYDGIERENLCPHDLDYAIRQIERSAAICNRLSKLLQCAKELFEGSTLANVWAKHSPTDHIKQEESEALASLKTHIDYYRSERE